MLRADPAHKIVNATLYRYEEALACWKRVSAPVLWVEGEEWDTLKSYGPNAGQLVERRAALSASCSTSRSRSRATCCTTISPEALAGAIEAFLAG